MTGAFWGADAAELDVLARRFQSAASELEGIAGSLGSTLAGTTWQGPDAELFQSDWHGVHARAVGSAVGVLRAAATKLDFEARQQLTASGATGAGSMPGSVSALAEASGAGMAAAASGAQANKWGKGGLSSRPVEFPIRWSSTTSTLTGPHGIRYGHLGRSGAGFIAMGAIAGTYGLAQSRTASLRIGDLSSVGNVSGFLGASAGTSGAIRESADGVSAKGGASAFVGTSASAFSSQSALGVQASEEGQASLGANADAKGTLNINPSQLSGGVDAGAFAGAQVSGTDSVSAAGFTGSVTGHAYAGFGAHADVTGSLSPTDVSYHVSLGIAAGLGAGIGFSGSVDPEQVVTEVLKFPWK